MSLSLALFSFYSPCLTVLPSPVYESLLPALFSSILIGSRHWLSQPLVTFADMILYLSHL